MRLYDKALVAKIHENQFTKEVDGIPVLFKPVPDAEPAHLDPRLREIIIKKRTMFANRAKAGWTLSSERYRPDKVTYDLIETPVDCTEQLIPIGGHKIDIYIYRTANIQPNAPVLVYLHGGGFTAGDIHLFGKQMQYIAEQSGAVVVFPEYRLAPENPFPAPVEDAWGTVQWVHAHAAELGADPAKLMVAGASAYPRAIDFEKLAEIAHGYGAMLMVDMAHIAGLVAGGQHQSPVPYADVVTTTTHKTLRGPRGGLILTNNEYIIKRINSAIFPGTQGGPLEHVIAAKAVCFGEALKPEFKEYARKIVENAKALEAELTARGVKLVSGGTDNHLLLIDLTDEDCTGKELEHNLDEVHITANKNTVPGEKRSPFVTSGVRIGTPAVTTRGMGPDEMKVIADCIADCVFDFANKKDEVAKKVEELTKKFPLYE